MASAQQSVSPLPLIFIFAWLCFWKGLGLWYSAKNNQRNWFVAMIILYPFTYGLLEIAYLFYFAKKRLKLHDLMFWKVKEK